MFRFEVAWWDSDAGSNNFERGYVAAKTYSKAMKRIINFYGKNNTIAVKLYEIEDILLDEDVIQQQVTPCEDRRPAGDAPV